MLIWIPYFIFSLVTPGTFLVCLLSNLKCEAMRSKHQDYEDNDSSGAGFATGLLLGAIVGACAALLYAPKSGDETRQELKDLADKQKENLKFQWELTKEKATEAVNTAKEKVNAFGDQAKNTVDAYADKAKAKVDHLADNAKSTVDNLQKRSDHLGEENDPFTV
jgi:gas vesicle protein